MAKVLVTDTHLTNIGNAIRNKAGVTTKYKPEAMAAAINNISSGVNTKDATATADDIVISKTAYISGGKTTGTLNLPMYEAIARGDYPYYYIEVDGSNQIIEVTSADQTNTTFFQTKVEEGFGFNIYNSNHSANEVYWSSSVSPIGELGFMDYDYAGKGLSASINTLNISKLNTQEVTNLRSAFGSMRNIKVIDMTGFVWDKVTNVRECFDGCTSLTEIKGIDTFNLLNTKLSSLSYMWASCPNLNLTFIKNLDTRNITEIYGGMDGVTTSTTLPYISSWNFSNFKNIDYFFRDSNISTINFTYNVNSSNLIGVSGMFANGATLQTVNLGTLIGCNKVNSLTNFFYNDQKLTTVYGLDGFLANIKSNCNSYKSAFARTNISNLSAIVHNMSFPATYNIDLDGMLAGCDTITSVNFTGWNMNNVGLVSNLFEGCNKLTDVNVAGWNFSKYNVWTQSMFANCPNLKTVNITGWNVRPYTTGAMFANCPNLTSLTLNGNWNFSNLGTSGSMFANCPNLTTFITNWEIPDMRTNNQYVNMFYGSNNLSSSSFDNIANMLPNYNANYCNNNNNLSYFGINQSNTKVNANLSTYFRTTMRSKGWNI